ncbi:MAG: NAD(P)-binding domain-containing protein, partial [Planctomycetota bacterium]|nr:NAD(P)-binding domain-containing protein [Planctomycetota bacterium]
MLARTFIGVGLIGAGFAEAALGRGEAVTVWNRSPEKAEALKALGASVAPSLKDAAKASDLIHVALTSDAAVDAVLAELAEHLSPEAVIVDHSTNLPEGTAKRAKWCAERSIHYLSAPIFMSPVACREAKGLIVVSGPAQSFERCRASLELMTGKLWYAGAEADRAGKLKLIGNGMILTLLSGLSDV